MDKKIGSVGRFFTMVLISTLSYCTRFCLCCLLVTLYFDMFCYKKNDLDMIKQLELVIVRHLYNKTVFLKTSPIEIEPKKIQHK